MDNKDRDTIYVINKFADIATFSWRHNRIVLPYNVPVEVDFTDEPSLLSNLLQCPQLQVCTKKELAEFRARERAKLVEVKPSEEVVQKDSEVEKLMEENENV